MQGCSVLGYGSTVLTPWMARQADNAVFTFEVVDNPDGKNLTVQAYDKNLEEYGSGNTNGSTTAAASGFIQVSRTGLKELVRFGLTVAGPADTPTGTGILYRMLPPTWYDEAHT